MTGLWIPCLFVSRLFISFIELPLCSRGSLPGTVSRSSELQKQTRWGEFLAFPWCAAASHCKQPRTTSTIWLLWHCFLPSSPGPGNPGASTTQWFLHSLPCRELDNCHRQAIRSRSTPSIYMRWHDSNPLVNVDVKLWAAAESDSGANMREVSPRKQIFWKGIASMIAVHRHFWFSTADWKLEKYR